MRPSGPSVHVADRTDLALVRGIALAAWPVAYDPIIGPDQVAYMLQQMYAQEALERQMVQDGHCFLLAKVEGTAVGFASFGPLGNDRARLHKLYVLPDRKGEGLGQLLLQAVMEQARAAGQRVLELNVNKYNPARAFYEHAGFRVVRDEVLDIGQGYVMDDHVMERRLD